MGAEFLLTSLVVVALPGTGVLYTLAVGLGRGIRPGFMAALGCTLGIVPHVIASIIGLAALLHASAVAFQTIKFAGVIYLGWMAWNILKDGGALDVREDRRPLTSLQIIRHAILINLLNPKLSLFFLAFLPQFVSPGAAHPTFEMLGLALIFMAMTLGVFVIYGACAAAARDHIISRPRVMTWLKRCFAGAFALMGLKLALADR